MLSEEERTDLQVRLREIQADEERLLVADVRRWEAALGRVTPSERWGPPNRMR